MSLSELQRRIKGKQATVAIIGLGYVGLPLACILAKTGFDVVGIELREEIIHRVNLGILPIEGKEPGLADMLTHAIVSANFRATDNYKALRDRDIVIVAVETPVDNNFKPRYHALSAALSHLDTNLKQESLVIIESTIAPGTISKLVIPSIEQSGKNQLNRDFYLGHCPERVMPGKLLANLENMNRVVGGMTPETAETMVVFYEQFVNADLDPTDCITAELVKTTENAYRDVQIAFANEVAQICEAVGGDVWKVRELVNKSPYRNMHLPGSGVGGHCITKDPWLLVYGVEGGDVPLRLIPAARAVNDSMPNHMVKLLRKALRLQNFDLDGSRVLILGYAYLEDSDDTRNSPSESLVQSFQTLGVEPVIHDPYVSQYRGDVYQKAEGCNAILLMVAHQEYRKLDLGRLRAAIEPGVLVDGRAVFDPYAARQAGFIYRRIGRAQD